ncbi:MAG: Ig-like domain repeat protein [Acidobacteriota bacterium]|nr:Ig-like domain repeat protein [Acidobacteriota bacterium]
MRVSPRLHFSMWFVVLGLAAASGARRIEAQEPAQRWDGLFELISARYDYPPPWPGTPQPANAEVRTSRHAISADGRYVIFTSDATNLSYSTPGVYRRDRRTGQTELLLGHPALRGGISDDGDHVTVDICDQWMRPDNLPICDTWALDLRGWMWTTLSTTPDGTFGNDASSDAVLSANGRFAVFATKASNLSGTPGGLLQIVLRDRDADGNGVLDEPGTAALETISVGGASGTDGGDADSDTAEVSDDGRYVAFRSLASNLVPGDTNGSWDVFLRDRQTGETRRLNVGPEGQQSAAAIDSAQISMSADGRYVAFASEDGRLAPGSIDDTNGVLDVFIYDAQTSLLSRLDVGWGWGGLPAYVPGNGPTGWPTLSADGRYVSLQSAATNVEAPTAPGSTHVYVVDRTDQRVTRVSIRPDGQDPDQDAVRPAISGDGSVVLFSSRASNLVEIGTTSVEQLYGAVHLEIAPAEVVVGGSGGSGTFTVTTQQHTLWWAEWDWSRSWVGLTNSAPYGVGSGSMDFSATQANPEPTRRSASIRVAQVAATLTQDVGLSLTSISPAFGSMAGGTTVIVRGTGFEPGMMASVGEMAVPEFIDSTTLTLVTPASPRPGAVPVFVGTPDGRYVALENAFVFTDNTPPQIVGWTAGNEGQNAWYIGDVDVNWGYWDPDSEVTSTTCTNLVITTDTPGTTYACSATSEGGNGYGSTTVKRDATPPAIAVTTPTALQLLELHSGVPSDFTCSDSTSGIAECGGGMPSGTALDTATPGWKTFTPGALDVAGNFGTTTVEYAVSSGVCTPPGEGLTTWLRFDGDLSDVMSPSGTINAGMPPDTYVQGQSGDAYKFVSRGSQALEHWHDGRLNFGSRMSVAMWLKPASATLGTLIKHQDQYRLERTAHGTINWMLIHPDTGPSFGTSYARAPLNAWSHVVFTYDAGEVKVYVNGRLDRTWNGSSATLRPTYWNRIQIGGPDLGYGSPYVGAFDELQFFNRALAPGDVEQMFLSGASGLCAPVATVLDVPSPIDATYAAGTYSVAATLRDVQGAPLVGKTISLQQRASDFASAPLASTTMVTDAGGTVRWDAPFDVPAGTYPSGFTAYFAGDLEHAHSAWVSATVVVRKAQPQITWAAPAPITYGAALSYSAHLNASASVPGSFSYSPGSGSVPRAGTQALTASFLPADYGNFEYGSATVSLEVARALPVVSITGGTFGYDGQPHAANASASDYRGLPLTPVSLTYDGWPNPPVAAGVYAAVATFAGDANHLPHSVTGTITIGKATPSIVLSASTPFTYDGSPHGVVASVYGAGGVLLTTVPVTYNGLSETPVDAGVYTASATFDGNASYTAATATATIRIDPATPVVTVSGGTFVYDKQAHGATVVVTGVAGQVLSRPVVVTYNSAADLPVGAGSYAVSASVAASGNYLSASGSGTLVINKATPLVSVTDSTFTYGAGPYTAPVTVTGVGGELLGGAAVTYNGVFSLPFTPGSYEVVATYAGSANYVPLSGNGLLTVVKAAPMFVVAGGTVTYDGQPHTAGVILAGSYGETLEPYIVTYNGLPEAPVNAGVYLLVATYEGAANYEASTATGTLTIQKATAALSLSGGAVTYDGRPHPATVSLAGVGSESPGPLVVSYNGSSAVPTNGGTYAVQASFAGSVNYAATTKNATITINPAVATLSVTGGTFTYDGQPHSAVATATGVAGETLSPVNVTYWRSGFGAFDAPVSVGTYDAAATLPASANYLPATVRTAVVIARAAPLVTWSTPDPIAYGTPLGSAQLTASANVPGTFSYSPAPGSRLNAGSGHALTATFSPADTANYSVETVSRAITVTPAPLIVRANDSVKRFGSQLPGFTATFAGLVYGESPASLGGTLAFATPATQSSPVGTYPIMAGGFSSPNYAIAFVNGVLTILKGSVAVAVSTSPEPSGSEMPMTFTATVTAAAPSAGSPAGTVRFFSGTTLIGSAGLSVGSATVITAGFDAGVHTIEARYDGDDSFETGAGSSSHTVNSAASTPSVSISSSRNPSTAGQVVTLTANVTMASGPVSGTVDFYDGATLIGSAVVNSGRATVSSAALSAGSHAITARFSGGAAPSVSPVFVQAVGSSGWKNRTTTTTVAASPNPSEPGAFVVLTATVTGSSSAAPVGRVLFMINGEVVGDPQGVPVTAVSGATVRAEVAVGSLAHGRHKVAAIYLGDPTYKGSSGGTTQTVN